MTQSTNEQERLEGIVDFIISLSPHNRQRGVEAVNDFISRLGSIPEKQDTSLKEGGEWEKQAREKVFNKLAFIGSNGQKYLNNIVFPFIRSLLSQPRTLPPGVSQWRNEGEKWGYDMFFEEKARREESERWNNAVGSVVDAETLEKIRAVIAEQERKLLTPSNQSKDLTVSK